MGAVSAVAGALAAFVGLVLYLLKRHDAPVAVRRRKAASKEEGLDAFDDALGGRDEAAVTRLFSELDDSLEPYRLRGEDGAGPGGQGDKASP